LCSSKLKLSGGFWLIALAGGSTFVRWCKAPAVHAPFAGLRPVGIAKRYCNIDRPEACE
jgi:hypothetical protein